MPLKPITVKTYDYNTTSAANWASDANGVPYNPNTTGIVATVSTGLTVVDLATTFGATPLAATETTVLTFNKAIDGTTIKTGLVAGGGTVAIKLSITAAGALTSSDANLGTVSGFTAPATVVDFTDAATLQLDATGKILTLTLQNHSDATTVISRRIVANGFLTYTPNAAIATPFAELITSATKNTAAALDSKPMIYTVASTSATNNDIIEATDTLTLTFSEALSPAKLNVVGVLGAATTLAANDTYVTPSGADAITFVEAATGTNNRIVVKGLATIASTTDGTGAVTSNITGGTTLSVKLSTDAKTLTFKFGTVPAAAAHALAAINAASAVTPIATDITTQSAATTVTTALPAQTGLDF